MENKPWAPIPQKKPLRGPQDELRIEPPGRPDASIPKDRNERRPEMGKGVDITPKDDSGEDDSGRDYSGNI
ncbi:MAG: hypothetical protein M3M85_00685 [bacterium]|nr:hypothetical protein [bacterium]